MATGPRFYLPYPSVFTAAGVPIPGALLNFYITQTNTRAYTYTDYNLTTPNANPVVALDDGLFPAIFLNPDVVYKVVLTGPDDGINPPDEIWTADPVVEAWGVPNTIYWDLPFEFLGGTAPTSLEVMGEFVAVRAMRIPPNFSGVSAGFAAARGHCLGKPADANFVITVKQNGATVGTITVAQTTGVFTFATSGGTAINLAAGDYLTFHAQSTPWTRRLHQSSPNGACPPSPTIASTPHGRSREPSPDDHLCDDRAGELRAADSYASVISPLLLPFTAGANSVADAWVVGLNTDWVYFWSQDTFPSPHHNVLQIVPTTITSPEVTADYLLATYSYDYPDDGYYFRQCVGPDGNLYAFGAAQTGTRDYKLWKCVPGTGFTDITPWSPSTGPNTNCADWVSDGASVPWAKHYLIKLPATNRLVCISKLFPADFSPPDSDPVHFRMDATYYSLSGGAFDYHEGFVYGYMDAAWAATDQAGAAWQVLDFRELDNDLESSDYLHSYDYTLRWMMFVCQAMSAGAPVDGLNKCVFVQYRFVYGSAPAVVQVVSEQGWDDAYPAYAAAVGQTEVVAASLPLLATSTGQATFFTNELAEDNVRRPARVALMYGKVVA
jgi:hypothetical protein